MSTPSTFTERVAPEIGTQWLWSRPARWTGGGPEGATVAGVASTGVDLNYFLQPAGVLIVLGGTLGVTVITTPRNALIHSARRLAELLGLDADAVNVKAKTGEGVGSIGRAEAIGCQAVVLIDETT